MAMREKVTVKGGDYTYQGEIVAIFTKRSGAVRCVVEDDNGRLFIHNSLQLGMASSDLITVKRQMEDSEAYRSEPLVIAEQKDWTADAYQEAIHGDG